jgi:hypothetical protein
VLLTNWFRNGGCQPHRCRPSQRAGAHCRADQGTPPLRRPLWQTNERLPSTFVAAEELDYRQNRNCDRDQSVCHSASARHIRCARSWGRRSCRGRRRWCGSTIPTKRHVASKRRAGQGTRQGYCSDNSSYFSHFTLSVNRKMRQLSLFLVISPNRVLGFIWAEIILLSLIILQ